MLKKIKEAAIAGSEKWKTSFNSGDGEACAKCYEEGAIMVATPFGEFIGKEKIAAFWVDLISQGFTDVVYIDRKIEIVDEKSAIISADWKMNKANDIITKELWVLQENGTALLREDHFEAQG